MQTEHVSQSECRDAAECGLKWFATWALGFRPKYPENMPQRVGSMGHAILNERVMAAREDRPFDPEAAADIEADRRGWGGIDGAEYDAALAAADTLAGAVHLDRWKVLAGPDGTPLAEARLKVDWSALAANAGLNLRGFSHLLTARAGMEGQMDIVAENETGTHTVDDFKFRQKPDLGGAGEDSDLPDPQGAFYLVILRALGVMVDTFRQINVYAGPWLSLDDFMVEGSPYVRDDGLPSMSLARLSAMVKPAVWAEAWRLLVERKRIAHSLKPVKVSVKTGKPLAGQEWKTPDDWDARQFIRSLESTPLVSIRSFRLDASVCKDIVRDMLGAVDAQLAAVAKGVTPSRHLRIFQSSPCVKRYGCSVQDACRASMGTGNAEKVMREQAAAGLLEQVSAAPLGVMPALTKAVA